MILRINGFALAAPSATIYGRMIDLLEAGIFDMEHLVPWLQEVVKPAR